MFQLLWIKSSIMVIWKSNRKLSSSVRIATVVLKRLMRCAAPAASTSGLPPFKLGQFSSAQEPAFPALRAHDPAVPPVSMSPWAPKASTAAAGAGPSSIAPMGFSSKAESASKVSAALAPASIAPPLGFFTGALGKQSSAETPSYTFGRQRSSEQAVLMEQLAQIVRSASPASVPPPTFSFGRGKQERQTEAGKRLSQVCVILNRCSAFIRPAWSDKSSPTGELRYDAARHFLFSSEGFFLYSFPFLQDCLLDPLFSPRAHLVSSREPPRCPPGRRCAETLRLSRQPP